MSWIEGSWEDWLKVLSTYLCMADAWVHFRPPYVSDKGDYTQAAQDEVDDTV